MLVPSLRLPLPPPVAPPLPSPHHYPVCPPSSPSPPLLSSPPPLRGRSHEHGQHPKNNHHDTSQPHAGSPSRHPHAGIGHKLRRRQRQRQRLQHPGHPLTPRPRFPLTPPLQFPLTPPLQFPLTPPPPFPLTPPPPSPLNPLPPILLGSSPFQYPSPTPPPPLSPRQEELFELAGRPIEELFELAGRPIVKNCIDGYNSTVFAYGQTGSGKTYTMFGAGGGEDEVEVGLRWGMNPRVFRLLFALMEQEREQRASEGLAFKCTCSFLGPQENLRDLLEHTRRWAALLFLSAPPSRPSLAGEAAEGKRGAGVQVHVLLPGNLQRDPQGPARSHQYQLKCECRSCSMHISWIEEEKAVMKEDKKEVTKEVTQVRVNNLSRKEVTGSSQVMLLIQQGLKNHQTGETRMNNTSSRSHSVFMCTIKSTVRGAADRAYSSVSVLAYWTVAGESKNRSVQLNLVDLAGSEK
ncbi:unnamed protein product [Closterium sp. Naga37s-1]|nr:unnamed protein product [Closterium sp. Naga37s-1]